MEKVYIIIVNYKNHLDTIECLESCLKSQYTNFQIIVVDNSPTNSSIDFISNWIRNKYYTLGSDLGLLSKELVSFEVLSEEKLDKNYEEKSKRILLIKASENRGFGAANNIAIKLIVSRINKGYIWLLNNDTVIEKETLNSLINSFNDSKNKIGLLGCTLLYYSDPDRVQGIGGSYNSWMGMTKHIGEGISYNRLKEKHIELQNKIDYVIGASIFTNIQFVKDVGLLCEDYFLYFEELDWQKRGEKFGYKASTCLAKVYHKEGRSINNEMAYEKGKTKLADFYSIRNRFLFTRKFYRKKIPFIYFSTFLIIINRIIRKQYDRIPLIMNAIFNHKDIRYK